MGDDDSEADPNVEPSDLPDDGGISIERDAGDEDSGEGDG